MESSELRFRHVGLSSDGAVIFCEMDNGRTYAMPLVALEKAEDWNPKTKPRAVGIIHDGYAAFMKFDTGVIIDFPSDFVLHVCEPSYTWHKDKGRAVSGVGKRIREIRALRGLTLDALAAKCRIAKPNLSRLENDKVTPKFETLRTVASGLGVHPALLLEKHKWSQTQYEFAQWNLDLLFKEGSPLELVHGAEMVKVFLAIWPEHRYAHMKLLKYAGGPHPLNPEKWASAKALAEVSERTSRGRPRIGSGPQNQGAAKGRLLISK